MIYQLKYAWPAKLAGFAVIRAATALGWHRYAWNVADHIRGDAGFELLSELTSRRLADEALSTLRSIVDADAAMMRQNQTGSQEAYQQAADRLYDAFEAAEDLLARHGR